MQVEVKYPRYVEEKIETNDTTRQWQLPMFAQ
jgi:hypothetical protein